MAGQSLNACSVATNCSEITTYRSIMIVSWGKKYIKAFTECCRPNGNFGGMQSSCLAQMQVFGTPKIASFVYSQNHPYENLASSVNHMQPTANPSSSSSIVSISFSNISLCRTARTVMAPCHCILNRNMYRMFLRFLCVLDRLNPDSAAAHRMDFSV